MYNAAWAAKGEGPHGRSQLRVSGPRRPQALAHELCHHFRGRRRLYTLIDHFRNKQDYRADRFADHLLTTDREIMAFKRRHPRLGEICEAAHFEAERDLLSERMMIFRNDSAIRSMM